MIDFFVFLFLVSSFLLPPGVFRIVGLTPSALLSSVLTIIAFFYLKERKKDVLSKKLIKVYSYYLFVYLLLIPLGSYMSLQLQMHDIRGTFLEWQFPFWMIVLLNTRKRLERCYWILVFVILVMCLYDLYCVHVGYNPYCEYMCTRFGAENDFAEVFADENRGGLAGRFGSTFSHPVDYSVCLFVCLNILYFGKNYLNERRFSCFFYLIFPLLLVNLFFTGSRAAIVSLFFEIVYLCSCRFGLRRIIPIAVLSYSFLLFLGSFKSFGKYQPFVESVVCFWNDNVAAHSGVEGSSFSLRMDQLSESFHEISGSSIFFGLGGGWPEICIDKELNPSLMGFESILFSGFTEFGVLGFFLIYVVFWRNLLTFNHRFVRTYNNYLYKILNSFIIAYVILSIMTGAYMWNFFMGFSALAFRSVLIRDRVV